MLSTWFQHAEAEVASNGDATQSALERASVDANSLIEKEELDVEKAISGIAEVQVCKILGHFSVIFNYKLSAKC